MAQAVSGGTCPSAPSACTFGAAIYPCVYDPSDVPFAYYEDFVDDPAHFKDYSAFATDLAGGTLPSVSYIKPLGYETEHPGYGDTISAGLTFVSAAVQAVRASPYASSTLVLITWDEGGGFFDHVAASAGEPRRRPALRHARAAPRGRAPRAHGRRLARRHGALEHREVHRVQLARQGGPAARPRRDGREHRQPARPDPRCARELATRCRTSSRRPVRCVRSAAATGRCSGASRLHRTKRRRRVGSACGFCPTGARSRSRAPRSCPASPAPMRGPRLPRPWSRCASARSTRSGRARARRSRAGSTRATGTRGGRSSRGWRPCDAYASWSLSSMQRVCLQPISTEMPPRNPRAGSRGREPGAGIRRAVASTRGGLRTSGRRLTPGCPGRARSSAASLPLASKLRPPRPGGDAPRHGHAPAKDQRGRAKAPLRQEGHGLRALAGGADRDGQGHAGQMPAQLPWSLEGTSRPAGSGPAGRGSQPGPPARADSPSPRAHARVAVHVLSRYGAQHGGRPRRDTGHRFSRPVLRGRSPGELSLLRHAGASSHLRHPRPRRDAPGPLGVGSQAPRRQLRRRLSPEPGRQGRRGRRARLRSSYRVHMAEFSAMRALDVWYASWEAEELFATIEDAGVRAPHPASPGQGQGRLLVGGRLSQARVHQGGRPSSRSTRRPSTITSNAARRRSTRRSPTSSRSIGNR